MNRHHDMTHLDEAALRPRSTVTSLPGDELIRRRITGLLHHRLDQIVDARQQPGISIARRQYLESLHHEVRHDLDAILHRQDDTWRLQELERKWKPRNITDN